MRVGVCQWLLWLGGALGLALGAAAAGAWAGEPVALRAEHFTVPPSTGPVTHVLVENLTDAPYQGILRLKLPEGWQAAPPERPVALKPRETLRVPFTVEHATEAESNSYPVEVTATGGGTQVVRKQNVVCASAPYLKPRVDGRPEDWEDAIPVAFLCQGKRTLVKTGWNPGHFCLFVAVEEARLTGYRRGPQAAAFDAVQFTIAPRDAKTGTAPTGQAARYEFLVTASASAWSRDRCFQLLTPGTSLSVAQERRELAPLEIRDAQVAVRRKKGFTYYECAIPFARMPLLRPTVGRELCFSLLVHDPDGTGVRDWGEAAGLWPWQRNPLAWCSWPGAQWGKEPPFDSTLEWGLCSSKR